MKTLSDSKLEAYMKTGIKIHETKNGSITTGFAIAFTKG
jgi:hypothetical protein